MDSAATDAERGDADPASQNSVPDQHTDQTDQSGQRRHSMGASGRASGGGPGLHKSRSTQSMILRRTGSTATTSRPYDWRSTRSYVSFTGAGQLPLSRSGKSLTSVRTRQTIISRKDYHEDLKPTIAAVSLSRCPSFVCRLLVVPGNVSVIFDESSCFFVVVAVSIHPCSLVS